MSANRSRKILNKLNQKSKKMRKNFIASLAVALGFTTSQVGAVGNWRSVRSQLTDEELLDDRKMFLIGRAYEHAVQEAGGSLGEGGFDMDMFRKTKGWSPAWKECCRLEADTEADWNASRWFREGRKSLRAQVKAEAALQAEREMAQRVKAFWREDPDRAQFYVD